MIYSLFLGAINRSLGRSAGLPSPTKNSPSQDGHGLGLPPDCAARLISLELPEIGTWSRRMIRSLEKQSKHALFFWTPDIPLLSVWENIRWARLANDGARREFSDYGDGGRCTAARASYTRRSVACFT